VENGAEDVVPESEQPEALRDAEDFLALFAHEIGSKLSAIKLASDELSDGHNGDLSTQQNYYLSIIKTSHDNTLAVMTNMLRTVVYRKGLALPLIHKSSFLLKECLEKWILPFELMACIHKIDFVQNCQLDKNKIITADKEKIQQILYNLLNNAFQYTGPEKKIELRLTLTKESLTFQIRDEGSGIPADRLPFLFHPYKLADLGKGSTGLGLYICKLYTDLLGGTIINNPHTENGACFIVAIPL